MAYTQYIVIIEIKDESAAGDEKSQMYVTLKQNLNKEFLDSINQSGSPKYYELPNATYARLSEESIGTVLDLAEKIVKDTLKGFIHRNVDLHYGILVTGGGDIAFKGLKQILP